MSGWLGGNLNEAALPTRSALELIDPAISSALRRERRGHALAGWLPRLPMETPARCPMAATASTAPPPLFPTSSYQNGNYFRDIVFVADTFGAPMRLALTPVTASAQTKHTNQLYRHYPGCKRQYCFHGHQRRELFRDRSNRFVQSGAAHMAPTGGMATTAFTASTAGTATVTAAAPGLNAASASLSIT